jgi:hypothetical protein
MSGARYPVGGIRLLEIVIVKITRADDPARHRRPHALVVPLRPFPLWQDAITAMVKQIA